jgi:predicted Zn-dependent protease
MNAQGMLRVFALTTFALMAGPAAAQIDLNRAFDWGKKAVKAVEATTKEFTEAEEIDMGEGISAAILGASNLHPDQNVQRYVNRVGRWIASQSERPDLPWVFGVLEAESISAFAVPGGYVYISRGLLSRLNSEAELAGVLGHEIAHIVRRHNLEAIKAGLKGSAFAEIGKDLAAEKIARRGGDAFGLKNAAAQLGVDLVKDGLFLEPLDRSLEFEADRIGIVLAARAGYDPYGLVAALQMLQAATAEDTKASHFLSTHPPPSDRIAELEKMGPVVLDTVKGQQVEARYRQVVLKAK